MQHFFIILAIYLVTFDALGSETQPVIGTKYPPLPKTCIEVSGTLLGETKKREAIAYSHMQCGNHHFLKIDLRTSIEANGHSNWIIANVLKIPPFRNNWVINDVSGDCTYDSQTAGNNDLIVAISDQWEQTPTRNYAPHIFYAYLVRGTSLEFKKLDTSKVSCEYFEDRD